VDCKYLVSAQSDGFKTRTHTDVEPGHPLRINLVPLRKIYFSSSAASVSPCPGGTAAGLTIQVRDSGHNLIQSGKLRLWTDAGSFASGSVVRQIGG
jgi:hypothetical protein